MDSLSRLLAALLANQQQRQGRQAWQGQQGLPLGQQDSRDVTECSSWGHDAVAVLPIFPRAQAAAPGTAPGADRSIDALHAPAAAAMGQLQGSVSTAGGGVSDSEGLSFTGLQR